MLTSPSYAARVQGSAGPDNHEIPLLAHRLRSARERAFAGRDTELRTFRAALTDRTAGAVIYLHGAGGVGKTTLLRRYAAQAQSAGRPVVRMDRCDPAGVVAAVLGARRPAPAERSEPVLLFDDFEDWEQAEPWLREEFLPGLPLGAVVVLAARARPGVQWTADPGWRESLRVLELGELGPDDAEALLDHGAAPDARRPLLRELGGGHPLALRLAAEAAAAGRDDEEVRLEVAHAIIRQVVGALPSAAHRQVLEVSAYAGRATEQLVRRTVPDADPVSLFRWLCGQPYVTCRPDGIRLRPYLRRAVRIELTWRDPARAEALRSLAGSAVVVERLDRPAFDRAVREALRGWRRLDLLARNPLVRSRMVAAARDHPDPAEALRAVLRRAVETMAEDPREGKAHRALVATYFGTAPTQEAAAERLGLPFSTYRRHLHRGLHVLCSLLWRRELT
jgi:hypothetical protein